MYIEEKVVAVEYCGVLQMWVLSVHFLSNVWCFNKWVKLVIIHKVLFLENLFLWNMYIFEIKGIIILIHRMEDKEGIGMIFVLVFIFLYWFQWECYVYNFWGSVLRIMEKVLKCNFIVFYNFIESFNN